MVQLTRALMSSSTFYFAAKSAYYANDTHFVVDSQETAPPYREGGPNSFTPHGTQSLPQSSTHTRAELTESGTPITMLPNMRSLKY